MATPTQKQQLDAAWQRLITWNNVLVPNLVNRLSALLRKVS